MRMFLQLFCLFGLHRRSRRRAEQYGLTIRSVCRGCHRPMIKEGNSWRMLGREERRVHAEV